MDDRRRQLTTRRSLIAALLIGAVGGPALAQSPSADTAARALVGTWRLVAFESRDSAGALVRPLGPRPQGRLSYDERGRMSAHLMNPDRPRLAGGDRALGTDADVRAAFIGYLAYYGRYSADPARGIVTHHVEGASFPNWVGVDQLRYYRLSREVGRDRLTIVTPPMPVSGRQVTTTLVWEREP
jgi:hypothetical protein